KEVLLPTRDLVVRLEVRRGPGLSAGLDESPAAHRYPALWGQPGADGALGEVGQRRGLLPPAGRDEVGERPLADLQTILRPAVLEHIDVSCVRVGEPEHPGRVVLILAGVQPQRKVAVATEAHVGEPGPAAVGRAHDKREMIEGRPKPRVSVDPGADPAHLRAQRLQQQREGPVELVAEAAAVAVDDLAEQVWFRQRYRLAPGGA